MFIFYLFDGWFKKSELMTASSSLGFGKSCSEFLWRNLEEWLRGLQGYLSSRSSSRRMGIRANFLL
jgi:hypothetical protein